VSILPRPPIDAIDTRILRALAEDPGSTVVALAEATGLARNTVHARLVKFEADGVLQTFERRIDPAAIGYPMSAYIQVAVTQRMLAPISEALAAIPEVVEVNGISGAWDLLVHIVARDADDLYRIAGRILDVDGVEKTTTGLVMRRLVEFRVLPLLAGTDR
jgi:DNA-binding Lrp family transcriptional regulator